MKKIDTGTLSSVACFHSAATFLRHLDASSNRQILALCDQGPSALYEARTF